ncbi:TauD/TfdA family dioxygenase [Novosphingobium sp. TH158]|uniref:TauD/TfdA dioxygenase family protein n=1 Tax=Novosphingobium sp. TH158 TaxID=2067455 RepID=UPI000C7E4CCC|nr:TauD/TfdA family dioxygenase [Novosphingobium sp. TH158]PLK26720.1 hypothetical protein C0V78_07340 [Novosphingobium sp. TH158]
MIEVKPIAGGNGIGCEVHGLTPADISDPAVRAMLMDTWIEHGVIVFRNVEGGEFQVALSKCFGEVQPHPYAAENPDNPISEIVQISYDPDNADIYEVDGQVLGGWLPWHQDLIYLDKVSRGSILRPVVLPYAGGKTGFVDKIKLYEKLSPAMQQRIEGLSVVYHFDMDVTKMRFGRPESLKVLKLSKLYAKLVSQAAQYPLVRHPLVYRQRETGRPVLNMSPYFAQYIPGLSAEESDEILTEVGSLCLQPENQYFHDWQENDMVLWDNWRMLHAAGGVPVDASRTMDRTQIMGDYGLGQLESTDQNVSDEMRITV